MRKPERRCSRGATASRLAFALVAATVCGASTAQVYRCDSGGKVEYRATPCPSGEASRTLEGNTRPPGASSGAAQGGTAAAAASEPDVCRQLQHDYEFANRQVRDALDRLQHTRNHEGLQAYGLRELENEAGRWRIQRSMIVGNAYPACAFTKTGNARIIKSNRALTWQEEFGLTGDDLRKCDEMMRELRILRSQNKRSGGQPRAGLHPPGTDVDILRREWDMEDRMNKMHCQQEWR